MKKAKKTALKKKAPKNKAKTAKKGTVKSASTNKSGVTPLGDRVLVKPILVEVEEEKTSFGLIIPTTVSDKEQSERPEQGIVVAVGPGNRGKNGEMTQVQVKAGDKIMFAASYSAKKIKINGVEHILISEEDILAALN